MGWDDINYQVLVSLGMKRNTQARDTYLDATASTPDYISSLASALCVFVNGELALGFLELSPSFYGF